MSRDDKWINTKLKYILKIKNGGTPKSSVDNYWTPEEIVWITPEDLSLGENEINTSKRKISEDGLNNSSANVVKSNSIVLSTKAQISNIKIVTTTYATNQGCKSIENNNNIDIRYFYYYFSIKKEYLNQLGRGTTFLELSNEALKNIEISVPPLKIQTYISNFLDQKTSEIDALIADKEKLITLLEEKRQAVITETVTKGLDPDVKMKDSGIAWIGEIPAHWEIKKVKYLFDSIGSGGTPKSDNLEYYNGEIPWINTGDLNDDYITENQSHITNKAVQDVKTLKLYPRGSLIVAMYGATIGKVGITNYQATTNQACCVLSEPNSVNEKFMYYWFISGRQDIIKRSLGGRQTNISQSIIKQLRIPIPDVNEQNNIVAHINDISSNVQLTIEKVKQQISKVQQYRESLIYEAVTGKIDLRDYGEELELLVAERGEPYGN